MSAFGGGERGPKGLPGTSATFRGIILMPSSVLIASSRVLGLVSHGLSRARSSAAWNGARHEVHASLSAYRRSGSGTAPRWRQRWLAAWRSSSPLSPWGLGSMPSAPRQSLSTSWLGLVCAGASAGCTVAGSLGIDCRGVGRGKAEWVSAASGAARWGHTGTPFPPRSRFGTPAANKGDNQEATTLW